MLVLDPSTAGLDDVLERRRRSGLDRFDEVWDGVLHMVPAPRGEHAVLSQQLAEILGPLARAAGLTPTMAEFNLGTHGQDYRVPDGGLHRSFPSGVWHATAALLVEILSPDDETWEKLPFYAAHEVDELLVLDPRTRGVHWLVRDGARYVGVARSALIDLAANELAAQIDWPPTA